ncbi:MAG: hypothetical protein CVT92_02745 [Bacteroidetes bacterium HGW-Bacteroidetes-1]|jgi:hypothetical protein|nr:MAG: hypothetical protein CVT92_02745 [Bacteroidetes bacterium HGW-Bacteroidetes-1]
MTKQNNKPASNKTAQTSNVPAKAKAANEQAMTSEQKQAAKAAAAEKHYQTQLAALIAAGIPQDVAEKALAALKPVHVARTGNESIKINAFQHALLKDVVSACKVYRNATGDIVPERIKQGTKTVPNPEAVSYSVEPFKTDDFNSLADIASKVQDVVSWFKPNSSKTGKACTTDNTQAEKIINEMYKAVALNIGMSCQPVVPAAAADKAGA